MQYTGLVSKLKIKASSFLVLFFTIQNEPNHWILQQPRNCMLSENSFIWKDEKNKIRTTEPRKALINISTVYTYRFVFVLFWRERYRTTMYFLLIFFSITSLTVTWLKSFNRLTTSVLQYIETSQLINLLVSTWWETLVVNGLT